MSTQHNQGPATRGFAIFFVVIAAFGLAAYWWLHRNRDDAPTLTATTLEVLARIKSPVEMRFYHGGDAVQAGESVQGFQARTVRLLGAYQKASGGKLSVAQLQITNNESASSAIADGIRPYNIEKGDAAYLGIVIQSGDGKEVLPVLSPSFEPALEADLTRALDRLLAGNMAKLQLEQASATTDQGMVEQVRAMVPNYNTLTLEEGTRVLQESMLSELQRTGADFDARLAELRRSLESASSSGSQPKQEELRNAITQAELEHAARLKNIVSNSTAQLEVLRQIKAAKP